jgi:hypothetical protein
MWIRTVEGEARFDTIVLYSMNKAGFIKTV